MCQVDYPVSMNTCPDTRTRASREIWLNAAYHLLVEEGIEAVKIMTLAKKLGLTRTGFYWHFRDIADLHAAIIDVWQVRNTGIMIERCATPADSLCAALYNLIDCWIDPELFDGPLDLAIRNWARNDRALQEQVDASDASRIEAVCGLFQRYGMAPVKARYRALTIVLTQTGYISMQVRETRAERVRQARHYVEIFAGHAPREVEIANFEERHSPD